MDHCPVSLQLQFSPQSDSYWWATKAEPNTKGWAQKHSSWSLQSQCAWSWETGICVHSGLQEHLPFHPLLQIFPAAAMAKWIVTKSGWDGSGVPWTTELRAGFGRRAGQGPSCWKVTELTRKEVKGKYTCLVPAFPYTEYSHCFFLHPMQSEFILHSYGWPKVANIPDEQVPMFILAPISPCPCWLLFLWHILRLNSPISWQF